jgi:hypothetical protein
VITVRHEHFHSARPPEPKVVGSTPPSRAFLRACISLGSFRGGASRIGRSGSVCTVLHRSESEAPALTARAGGAADSASAGFTPNDRRSTSARRYSGASIERHRQLGIFVSQELRLRQVGGRHLLRRNSHCFSDCDLALSREGSEGKERKLRTRCLTFECREDPNVTLFARLISRHSVSWGASTVPAMAPLKFRGGPRRQPGRAAASRSGRRKDRAPPSRCAGRRSDPGLVSLPSAGYQEGCKIRRSRW